RRQHYATFCLTMQAVPNYHPLNPSRGGFMSRVPLMMVCLILVTAGSVPGQITGGSFVGIVTDPSGLVLVDAQVEAMNVGTNVVSKTVTNAEGYYEFPLLPPGNYILSVQRQGFRRASTAEIELHAGTKPRINFRMVLGQVTEAVEVVGQAPLVNATTTDLGVVI